MKGACDENDIAVAKFHREIMYGPLHRDKNPFFIDQYQVVGKQPKYLGVPQAFCCIKDGNVVPVQLGSNITVPDSSIHDYSTSGFPGFLGSLKQQFGKKDFRIWQ